MTVKALPLEALLKRDRRLVAVALVLLALLCWAYTVHLTLEMHQMEGMAGMDGMADMEGMQWMEGMEGMDMAMPMARSWSATDLLLLFLMWTVMMIAMMTPSAAPMILLFAAVNRKRREREAPYAPTAAFVGGYLAIWTLYSLLATVAQWALHQSLLLTPMMASASPFLGGAVLVAAGAFQWTPLKNVCLAHCRTPLGFISNHWREGWGGAFTMGIVHGRYCAGCCWALMLLLFVGGVMNLVWVAGLTIFVLVEKIAPAGLMVGRVAGVALIAAGVAMMVLR